MSKQIKNVSILPEPAHGGRPILLLHGIQGTAKTWDAVAPLLDRHHPILTPNLRGRAHAYIPNDVNEYRLEAFASDLLAAIRTMDRAPILVAWSMGVSVVLTLLNQYPDLDLSGLVLVSGSACVGTEAQWFKGGTVEEVTIEARERSKRLALVEAAEPHAVAASWKHVQARDFRNDLPAIAYQTLIIHGTDDDQCPITHGRLMAAKIPEAQMDEWPATGHNPMAADPVRFAQAILSFANTL